MVRKMRMRSRSTTSLYLIESREAERKLREARSNKNKGGVKITLASRKIKP
jgi:hypothetical protein